MVFLLGAHLVANTCSLREHGTLLLLLSSAEVSAVGFKMVERPTCELQYSIDGDEMQVFRAPP